MRAAAGVEHVGDQLRIVGVAQRDAVLRQHDGGEFDVVADLEDAGRFQHRPQRLDRIGMLDLVGREAGVEQARTTAGLLVRQRHIAGIVRRQRQRDAAEIGLHRIDRVCPDLDRDMAGIMDARDKGVELLERLDRLVFAPVDRKLAQRLFARGGERDRRALRARGLVLLARRCVALARPGLRRGAGSRRRDDVGGRQRREDTGAARIAGIGIHIGRVDLRIIGDATRQRGEFHRLQEGDQLAGVGLVDGEIVQRHLQLDLVVEQHELPRDARLLRVLDQRLAPLRLLDLGGAEQQLVEVAIFGDQLCGGLDADAGHARYVVGGIAGQRLHLHHLLRRHAEFLDHLRYADAAILHGVVHGDAIGDELHQVLVGRHDGGGRTALAGLPHIGGDQIVGLEAHLFQAGQVEGAHRLADQRELRDQIVRGRRPVRLVFRIDLVAEGDFRLVEDDRQMRRPVVLGHLAQQLPQHVAEAEHGIDLQPVGLAVQRRQRVIGAEDVGGTVDQEDMVALPGRLRGDGFGSSDLLSAAAGRAWVSALAAVFGEVLGMAAMYEFLRVLTALRGRFLGGWRHYPHCHCRHSSVIPREGGESSTPRLFRMRPRPLEYWMPRLRGA